MDNEFIKKRISLFLDQYPVGVLSTIDTDKNVSESAAIGFAHTANLELIFGTSNTSRKYKNLQTNSHISFVTGWDSVTGTIQYEGVAKELSLEEAKQYSAMLVKKNNESGKYIALDDERFFLVKPHWIRLLDNTGNPPDTYEINL